MSQPIIKSSSILIVEDDEMVVETIQRVLTREDFTTYVSSTGANAIDVCREEQPDIVLLDIELPDMDGWEVCRSIRTFSSAYVIMLTGRRAEDDKLASFDHGADDYVTKPFSSKELVARIHSQLRRPRVMKTPATALRSFGSLTIDPASRRVVYRDSTIPLTKTEFGLLERLTRTSGEAVSREDLIRDVWGTKWSDDDRLLDVHMHNLRRKLEKSGMPPKSIETVRGLGFRFAFVF
jgi:DNA-binding response OmpR family regulator